MAFNRRPVSPRPCSAVSPSRNWPTTDSISGPPSSSASLPAAVTSSRTTAPASTARRKRLRGCLASLVRWSPPSCCNFRCAARSATGCALSPVAVLASEGSLVVLTSNRWIELRPERDGDTTVVNVSAVKYPVGTRVEINFGPALPDDSDALFWAAVAQELSLFGTSYVGKSSPWWYDAAQFHE